MNIRLRAGIPRKQQGIAQVALLLVPDVLPMGENCVDVCRYLISNPFLL